MKQNKPLNDIMRQSQNKKKICFYTTDYDLLSSNSMFILLNNKMPSKCLKTLNNTNQREGRQEIKVYISLEEEKPTFLKKILNRIVRGFSIK